MQTPLTNNNKLYLQDHTSTTVLLQSYLPKKKNYQKASFPWGLQRMGAILLLLPRSRGSMAKSGLCTSRAQPWHPTFALRLLEDTGFFIQIIFLGTFDFTGWSSRHPLILMGSIQFSFKRTTLQVYWTCNPTVPETVKSWVHFLPWILIGGIGFHGVMA